MSQLQYIADGYNVNRERVVLWRVSEFGFELEIAGKTAYFPAFYNDAVDCFLQQVEEVVEMVEAPEDLATVA